MLRMKDTNKLIKNVLRALPAIPYFAPKKTSSLPFVLGAIGVAVIGGVAAVMAFSPRTRYRALDVAKDGYGKVRGQLDQLRTRYSESDQLSPQQGYSNSTGSSAQGSNYTSSGI
jgi:hypothetical protein